MFAMVISSSTCFVMYFMPVCDQVSVLHEIVQKLFKVETPDRKHHHTMMQPGSVLRPQFSETVQTVSSLKLS